MFVDNLGPSYARDVLITDVNISDAEFTIISAGIDPAGDCAIDRGLGIVSCSLDDALDAVSPSTAVNVPIEDTLPAGLTINFVIAPGGTCNAGVPGDATQPTTCIFDTMSVSYVQSMDVEGSVMPGTRGILHNDSRFFSEVFDSNNDTDLVTVDTVVAR